MRRTVEPGPATERFSKAPSSSLAQDIWFSARRLGFKSPWGYEAAVKPPLSFCRVTACSAVLVLVAALICSCDPEVGPFNRPPTVVITVGPEGSIGEDSAFFAWSGQDRDGNLAGYLVGFDDSVPGEFMGSASVTWRGLTFGRHTFYVQAVDDSGATSAVAARSFDCQYRGGVRPRGTDSTLELVTWNIENFPKAGSITLAAVRTIVRSLNVDLIAVQEIADTIAFRALVAGLDGYNGFYSADDYGSFYQKTGVMYRAGVIDVSNVRQLFWRNDSVTRPPLSMQVVATVNGRHFDFELIVVHLKAGGSADDHALRRATCRLLKDYIDGRVQGGADPDFIVAGDFNDRLDDPPSQNSLQTFLDDTAGYRFLTLPLAGNSRHASYIGGSLIDHVLVTRDVLGEYGDGRTETLRLDDEITEYLRDVSDHRPVMAVFALSALSGMARRREDAADALLAGRLSAVDGASAEGGSRTHKSIAERRILSPLRLPVPPLRPGVRF